MATSFFGISCLFLVVAGVANVEMNDIDHPHTFPKNIRMPTYRYQPRNSQYFSPYYNRDYFKLILEDTYDVNSILNRARHPYRDFEIKESKNDKFQDTNSANNFPNTINTRGQYPNSENVLIVDDHSVSSAQTESKLSNNAISSTEYSTSYGANAGSAEVMKISNSDPKSSETDKVQSTINESSSLETSSSSSQNTTMLKDDLSSAVSNSNNDPSDSNANYTSPGVPNSSNLTPSQEPQPSGNSNTSFSDMIPSSTKSRFSYTADFENDELHKTADPKNETNPSITDSASNSGAEDSLSTDNQNTSFTRKDLSSVTNSMIDSDYSVFNTTTSSPIVDGTSKKSSSSEFESNSEKEESIDSEQTFTTKAITESFPDVSDTTLNHVTKDSSTLMPSKDEYMQSTGETKVSRFVSESTTGDILTTIDLVPSIWYTSNTVKDKTTEGSYSTTSKELIQPEDEDSLLLISQPDHIIEISSIRTAKTVVSVVFLVIALVATSVLAIYMIKIKRREVQYDQLTLLP